MTQNPRSRPEGDQQMPHSIHTNRLTPPRTRLLIATALLSGVLALAGCGGSSTSGVASVATPATAIAAAPGPAAGGSTQAKGLLAYSSCMRSHGVPNFPDPSGSIGIGKEANIRATREVGASKAE